ncbi:tuberous sclerosis 2 protein [Podospora fimiseda]|uniref:Tuberous sclerosis 2 protein n=1 Tax=Podospora fimiseda TaxID=252190 RepID=A0AAN7H2X2_9PEZI|nr:tuberous sclerosis 2 protein [Podospora fimiseda]
MFRRIVSLGHSAPEEPDDLEHMSPSPGDEVPPQEHKTSGGLAGVFKGLAGGGKLTKSPPPTHQSLAPMTQSQPLVDQADLAPLPTALRGLPPDQAALYLQLQRKNGPLGDRVAAANSLRYAIVDYPLNPVFDIWFAGKDLIEAKNPTSARTVGWQLLTECVKYPSATELERHEYFKTLTAPANPEDFHLQLAALEDLTNRGRNVAGFPYEIFPLLVNWLQNAFAAVKSARRIAGVRDNDRSSKGKALTAGEESNFSQMFVLLKDTIKFNFKFARDNAVAALMDMLMKICMNTHSVHDLRACIEIVDTLVTFGAIPNQRLRECILTLGSIHCMIPDLHKTAWHTFSNICRSHHGQSTVRILLDVLRTYPVELEKSLEGRYIREARGTVSLLKKLVCKPSDKGYPTVPLALLMDGLSNVSRSRSAKLSQDILLLINSLLDGRDGSINTIVAEEHWSLIFQVAVHCASKVSAMPPSNANTPLHSPASKNDPTLQDNVGHQLRLLVSRVEILLAQKGTDFLQRDECIKFFTEVQQSIPDSAAGLVISYFREHRSCFPSDTDWKKNLDLIIDGFYLCRIRDPLTRLHALEVVIDVYNFICLAPDLVGENAVKNLIRRLLEGMSEETNTLVLQDTVNFLVQVAESATPELFQRILDGLKKVVSRERSRSALPALASPRSGSHLPGQALYRGDQSLSNVVTRGYVQIFIRTMNIDGYKAVQAFQALIHIARSKSCEIDARLTAMKMLFRLRADFEHRIYLSTLTENESLAASIYRTESSLQKKLEDDAAQPPRTAPARPGRMSIAQGYVAERGVPSRQVYSPKPSDHQSQRLWSVPDPDALPEAPPERPSWFLFSKRKENLGEEATSSLSMSSWLDAILGIFHNGSDWEVYSYVLTHLPAQLSNHPLFTDAITYVHELRRVICEMIRQNSFQEPPSQSGLRRNDVSNCLFHSLVMITSYHEHFQKVDEDDIVRTFTHGITDKTAKTCIHALQVCCHELPMSVSKSLIQILQRMSQVITQPFVAMHILEFLACLSRQPSLYANFRDDDYRIIFGICARYLQSVRDKKNSTRGQSSEPPTPSAVGANQQAEILGSQSVTDDLPQYVHALAYHVITFWFLALKLHDRPSHVGWIARNLFVDSNGQATNEEQAQVTLDFMQRVAYSDACDSAQDDLFNEEHFGEIEKKRWIIGNSIVTIRQAKETGWAEITRRYPSGTSSFAIRVEFTPMPNQEVTDLSDAAAREGRFQHGITIFPSHLLMQLLCSLPQMSDPTIRPIPLPDDDAMDRAIRLFDLNSTVDGHKVGVIYIGEGQTNEIDILANTIGGPDYLEFLKGLGALTRLKGATFNTQGLDRTHDIDGRYTYCWRDRVTEIVFHVTTQMPTNLERDPQCIFKKRHIGNDFVNIIWNDSGLPFRFNMFPSEFNYVYIVITPAPRPSFAAAREMAKKRHDDPGSPSPFFMVQVMSAPGFPEISPCAEPKMISLKALPRFVRLVALNASVFSLVWANRQGDYVSSWRNRLQQIHRLRERYGLKVSQQPVLNQSPPPSAVASSIAAAAAGSGNYPGHIHPQHSPLGSGGNNSIESVGGVGGLSRPPSGMRDSFSSLRRSSVATFFTSGGSTEQTSHRSSMLSMTTADNAEGAGQQQNNCPTSTEALVDSVDFSKWT